MKGGSLSYVKTARVGFKLKPLMMSCIIANKFHSLWQF